MFDYYAKYSQVFPNYTAIKASKYMYTNIEWKQNAIDERYRQVYETKKKSKGMSGSNCIFTTKFLKELNKPASLSPNSSFMQDSLYKTKTQTQIENYKKSNKSIRKPKKEDYDKMNLQEIVEKVILKDSQSFIKPSEKLNIIVIQHGLKKKNDNINKVLNLAKKSKQAKLQDKKMWNNIKEQIKHRRSNSQHNLSSEPIANLSMKNLNGIFPLSCRHDEQVEKKIEIEIGKGEEVLDFLEITRI